MKGQKKQEKSSETAGEQPGKMNRKDFLKALGIGVGAAGITSVMARTGLAAGGDADQAQLQGFIRTLIENPNLAADFMKDPEKVAKSKGVKLSDSDLKKVKESIRKVKAQEKIQPGSDVGRDYSIKFPDDHSVSSRPGMEEVVNPADKVLKQPDKVLQQPVKK